MIMVGWWCNDDVVVVDGDYDSDHEYNDKMTMMVLMVMMMTIWWSWKWRYDYDDDGGSDDGGWVVPLTLLQYSQQPHFCLGVDQAGHTRASYQSLHCYQVAEVAQVRRMRDYFPNDF